MAHVQVFHSQSLAEEGWPGALLTMNKIWCRDFEKYLGLCDARIRLAEVLKLPDEGFLPVQESSLKITIDFSKNLKKSLQENGFSFVSQPDIFMEMIEEPNVSQIVNGAKIVIL